MDGLTKIGLLVTAILLLAIFLWLILLLARWLAPRLEAQIEKDAQFKQQESEAIKQDTRVHPWIIENILFFAGIALALLLINTDFVARQSFGQTKWLFMWGPVTLIFIISMLRRGNIIPMTASRYLFSLAVGFFILGSIHILTISNHL
ncbi:MAG: hypothetical protein PVG66_03510 [Chromatiales bacterium]|jgi:hypothetical protein